MIANLALATHLLLTSSGATWLDDHAPDHELITLADGLSDSTVFSIAQDRWGRMWFGTGSGGADVFDGHVVTALVHDPDDPTSLSHSDAGAVFVDSRGELYIGTWGGGLNRLAAPHGRFQRLAPDAPPSRVQTLHEDPRGQIWIGSGGEGLFRIGPDGQPTPVAIDGTSIQRIWDIADADDGGLWIAADDELYEFHEGQITSTGFTDRFDDQTRALARFGEDLWIGSASGLYRLGPEGDVVEVEIDLPTINTMEPAPDGTLLIGTLAGLYALDRTSQTLVPPFGGAAIRLFQDRNVRDVFFDATGVAWLATREAGVIKFHGGHRGFRGFDTSAQLETVDTLVELPQGDLLIGSRRGLWRLSPGADGAGHMVQIPGFETRLVNALSIDNGTIHVATRSGLYVFDPESNALSQPERFERFADRSETLVRPSPSGDLWVGVWNEGLTVLPADGGDVLRFTSDGEPALSDDFIGAIEFDDDGGVWLGHWYEGVSRLDPASGSIQRFRTSKTDESSVPPGHIHGLLTDGDSVWVATSFGFARIDRTLGTVQRIPVSRQDLPTSVQRLADDGSGHIWLATTRGIKRYRKSDGQLIHYGRADGMITTEFYARSGTVGADGRLYFGGIGGLVSFDPPQVPDRFESPRVYLSDFTVDDRAVEFDTGLATVPPGTRKVAFTFTAADYKSPSLNRYRYRLHGEDDGWSDISGRNTVDYAALPPGSYRFEVLAANSNGVWSELPASLAVVVEPYWWQTVSGRAAVAIALLLIVYAGHRIRTSRILRANRELAAEVERQTRFLQRANQELAAAAVTDFLTGLPNRRGFFARLSPDGGPIQGTVALADVDNFKAFNDRHGHEVGDRVLTHVARQMAEAVRPSDLVARWGGEEFIFFFSDTDMAQAEIIAERVRRSVQQRTPESDSIETATTITMGLAEVAQMDDIDHAIDRADRNLYLGKQQGKNRVISLPPDATRKAAH